jgi:mannose-6-phosphate isomerase-like protein (cupin superfamily)
MSKVKLVGFEAALAQGPPPPGNLAVPIFARGSLEVELYTPVGKDPQKPHTRDELYFVAKGRGLFYDGENRHEVKSGSFVFVPARQEHRFEDFSDDFAVWVVFFGDEASKQLPTRTIIEGDQS